MRRYFTVIVSLFAVLLTACSGPGNAATPSSSSTGPTRIVVIDYGALDTLDTLGLGDRVVGTATGTLPHGLEKFAKVTNIGTLKEPNIEAIAGLKPDLIIVGARSAAKANELGKIATTMDMSLDYTNVLSSNSSKTMELAKRFGKEADATARLAALDAAMKKTAEAKTTKTGLIIMVSGGKLSAFGPGSRFGFIHTAMGIPAADPSLTPDAHGQAVSFEYIAKVNPDIIYVIDRDAAVGAQGKSAAQVLDNDLVKATKAAQQNSIVYLDGSRWYLVGGGLTTLQAMIDETAAPLAK